jgi:hypothetical protein
MTDIVVVRVKPGSRKGPLVEVGSTGELTIYVREPAVDGRPPPIAKKPRRIGVRSYALFLSRQKRFRVSR